MKNRIIAGIAVFIFVGLLIFSGYFIIGALHKDSLDVPLDDPGINGETVGNDEIADDEDINIALSHESEYADANDAIAGNDIIDSDNTYFNDDMQSEADKIIEPEPEPEPTKVAYLTFDDGPSREVTPGILDVLSEEGIQATFFVISRSDAEDIYKRIIDEGHELGNHSFSHNFRRLYNSGIDSFKNDTVRMHDFLNDNFGYTAKVYRFPGGSMSWRSDTVRERIEVLMELGYSHFDWHIDSGDADSSLPDHSAERLAGNVLNNTNEREHIIILMHDFKWRQTTLEALPIIITGLREQGYRFDILSNYPD